MLRSPTSFLVRSATLAAILLVANIGLVAAQPADTLRVRGIQDLVTEVRLGNSMLKAASLASSALKQRPAQVGALPDPVAGLALQPFPLYTARGAQRSQWQISQAIPYPGKLALRAEEALLKAEEFSVSVAVLELDLVERIGLLYADLLLIRRQRVVIRKFQRQLTDFEGIADVRYRVGEGTQQAILKAQLERNALSNRLLALDRRERTVVEQLSNLVNRPVSLSEVLRPGVLIHETPPESQVRSMALSQRPELKANDLSMQVAQVAQELASKERLPDFGVSLTYFDIRDSSIPASADGRDAIAVGVSVKIPLQRKRIRAREEEARVRRLLVEVQREALESAIRTTVDDLVYRLDRTLEQISLFDTALIPQAESALQATLITYSTGRSGFLDLLDAQRMLFELSWAREEALSEFDKAGVALQRALGKPMSSPSASNPD
jgi:cobalt-zinc-cadmium efflux system outer membrane protein